MALLDTLFLPHSSKLDYRKHIKCTQIIRFQFNYLGAYIFCAEITNSLTTGNRTFPEKPAHLIASKFVYLDSQITTNVKKLNVRNNMVPYYWFFAKLGV